MSRGRKTSLRRRSVGGSASRAAAGALRIGNAVGAAITDRRVLGPAEAGIMSGAALVLLAVALIGLLWPLAIVLPLLCCLPGPGRLFLCVPGRCAAWRSKARQMIRGSLPDERGRSETRFGKRAGILPCRERPAPRSLMQIKAGAARRAPAPAGPQEHPASRLRSPPWLPARYARRAR
jgi:hypothetical protein